MNSLRRLIAIVVGLSLTQAGAVFAQSSERTLIRDRNGVTLVDFRGAAGERPFPLGANAAQLLAALCQDARSASGKPLDLTLDARIQTIAERALRAVPRGAAVVIDPGTGDILAMASVPSFDPNIKTPEAVLPLAGDETKPLANRAIREAAPGAAFMVVTGLAGGRKGLGDSKISCSGSVFYGDKEMKCWISAKGGEHGLLSLDDAMKASCGPYFFQYGNKAGIADIVHTGKLLGLGMRSGLPLPEEEAGILPGPEWLRTVSPEGRWSMGYTANVSIGQGSVTATPLQMAMVAATIGNGGRSFFPRLLLNDPVRLRVDLRAEGWKAEQIEVVRRGMWRVVNEGGSTGARARIPEVSVAGKTGTAQSWRDHRGERVKDNHAWFIAFAPYENPKFAVCVFVEGARSGGGVSAPIAGRILAECLHPTAATPIEALEAAKGSFEPVEAIGE